MYTQLGGGKVNVLNSLNDNNIVQYTAIQLLGKDVLKNVYKIQDKIERERIKALLLYRASELKIEKEFAKIIKAYDSAQKILADEYTKQNADKHTGVILKFDGKGQPIQSIDNFLNIIRNDSYFSGLKFNLLTYSPEKVSNNKTERWTDSDDSSARHYIEKKYNIHNTQKLDDALRIVFKEREYHPVRQLIESIKWDGIERISTLLCKWLKCIDSEYIREVSRLIFSGGINRIYEPGCKFDDIIVLLGKNQGEGKSTFVRWLAMKDEYFGEVSEIESQKGIESIEGLWICELGELLALTRVKDVEAVKSYTTRLVDRYRKPFDKRVSEHKRQCIFIGTTNKEQFLTDKTGNRRWYPVKVFQNGYDLYENQAEIKNDIKQCWAEAKHKYDLGKMSPFANKDLKSLIMEQQSNAVEDDYRDGLIHDYIEDKDTVCILELWKEALENQYSKPTRKDSNDIALILQATGEWESANKTERIKDYGVQRVWIRTANKNKESLLDKLDDGDLPFM